MYWLTEVYQNIVQRIGLSQAELDYKWKQTFQMVDTIHPNFSLLAAETAPGYSKLILVWEAANNLTTPV